MTDNEIIKALECCIAYITDCENCPYHIVGDGDCVNKTKADAINLINRQQAEIERLKTEKDNLIKTYAECQVDFLKEFVNKLKTWHSYAKYDVAGHQQKQIVISEVTLDNLVKEMGCGE